ncbi:MAG: isoprenylcysteine carboxylmethyltransferase family protein [Candidatus Obscuribacterales bacterium]|nr:isoprenylcysteine carboxylmethyltransferase family protein [Candidatus Obscuribacterales bacterium]
MAESAGIIMDRGVLILICLNFIYIALLPVLFFKKDGGLNWKWLATSTPFGICPLSLIASYQGLLPRLTGDATPWGSFSDTLPIFLSSASIALISYTLGTHKIPIALWHQNNDAPQSIVTYGAYKWIRHPFYASFLIAFSSAFLYAPQLLTIACLIYGLIALNLTAAREEKRLCQSDFGQEYQRYMDRTGRFLPKFLGKAG